MRLLPEWYDVDDLESLRVLCRELFDSGEGSASGVAGASTRALLRTLLPQLGESSLE